MMKMTTPKSWSRDDDHHRRRSFCGGEEKENSLRGFVLPRKSRQEHAKKSYHQGRWSDEERLLFLKGLRRFGAGQWKEIGLYVTTRSISQIKSHGQTAIRQLEAGDRIFQELTWSEANGVAPQSPANLLSVVADSTIKRRSMMMMLDPAAATLAASAPATTNDMMTSAMATVQVDSGSSCTATESLTIPSSAAPSTVNIRSMNEIIAAEALCALITSTRSPLRHSIASGYRGRQKSITSI